MKILVIIVCLFVCLFFVIIVSKKLFIEINFDFFDSDKKASFVTGFLFFMKFKNHQLVVLGLVGRIDMAVNQII